MTCIYIYIMIQKIRNLEPVYYVLYCIFIIFLKYVYFVFVSPDADTLSRTHQNLTLSSKKRYLVRYRVTLTPGTGYEPTVEKSCALRQMKAPVLARAPSAAAILGVLGEAVCDESQGRADSLFDEVPGNFVHAVLLQGASEPQESEPHGRAEADADEQITNYVQVPIVDDEEDHDESADVYQVEQILDERSTGKASEYLIKWKGFGSRFNSWEPRENILDVELIEQWQRLRQQRRQKDDQANATGEETKAKVAARSKRERGTCGAKQTLLLASAAPGKEGQLQDDLRDSTLVIDMCSFWLPRYQQNQISEGAQLMNSSTLSLYLNNRLGGMQMLQTETKLRAWAAGQREAVASGKSILPSPWRGVGQRSADGRGHGDRRALSQMPKSDGKEVNDECDDERDDECDDEEESGGEESEGEGEQRIESCIREMRQGKKHWIMIKWQGDILFAASHFLLSARIIQSNPTLALRFERRKINHAAAFSRNSSDSFLPYN